MNKWLIGVLVLVVIAGVWYFIARTSEPATGETIRIGAVLGLTGNAAADSLNIKRGIELAKDDLAKKGVMVEIKYEDDATDPKQTVSAIQYLNTTYHPQAIIGPTWSFLESAAASTIAENKIISFAPANTSEFADVKSSYQFHGAPRNALMREPIAAWLKANNKKRAMILVEDGAWGHSVRSAFLAATKDANTAVVIDEQLAPFSSAAPTDTSTALTKAKTANVDIILWTGYEPDGTTLVKRREELGLNIPIITPTTVLYALYSRNVISRSKLQNVHLLNVSPAPAFAAEFEEKYGEAPGNYAERAYDGLMILVEAIRKAPTQDADSLANYLRNDLEYTGYGGEYKFNDKGDVIGGEWIIKPIVE